MLITFVFWKSPMPSVSGSATTTFRDFAPEEFIVLLNDMRSRSSSLQSKHLHRNFHCKLDRTWEAVHFRGISADKFPKVCYDPKCWSCSGQVRKTSSCKANPCVLQLHMEVLTAFELRIEFTKQRRSPCRMLFAITAAHTACQPVHGLSVSDLPT